MMTNKDLMYKFVSKISDQGLITKFLKNIFNYQNLSNINYIFRVSLVDKALIMDVFDNISENRFNRYYFEFKKGRRPYIITESANIFVTRINVLRLTKNINFPNNLLRLGYLFKLHPTRMINYAKTFLNEDFIIILNSLINRGI